MTRNNLVRILGVALASGTVGFAIAASITGSPDRFGPYTCSACQLQTPLIDAATLAYINVMENANYNNSLVDFNIWSGPGDTYTICSGSVCVTYTRTSSYKWEGATPVQIQSPSGGGGVGGSGGSTSGPGGFTPVGNPSTAPNGSGTVIVKNPSKIREK